jgi:DNA polymerase
VVFVGEAPGRDEDRYGRPFVGKTGKEFNEHYLTVAGLRRDDIYMTNTVKCHLDNDKEMTP